MYNGHDSQLFFVAHVEHVVVWLHMFCPMFYRALQYKSLAYPNPACGHAQALKIMIVQISKKFRYVNNSHVIQIVNYVNDYMIHKHM